MNRMTQIRTWASTASMSSTFSAAAVVVMLGTVTRPCAAAQATGAPAVERGKAVYKEQNCATCHAVAGVGNRRSPLDNVGAKLNEETIRKWIVSPRDMNPTVRKKGFDKLSKADLDALVAYLRTLKAPAGK